MWTIPQWISALDFSYQTLNEVPQEFFDHINQKLDVLQNQTPAVSIVIIVKDEEVSLLRTIASLAEAKTRHPLELIVINNGSTDKTQETLNRLHVRSYIQPIIGWGPARQMGLEKARGKYILQADADCFYPPKWVDTMIASLSQPGVVCVYGRHSFLTSGGFPRWKLLILETLRDVIMEVRQINRPYLNAFGHNMGYLREFALSVGFIMEPLRGEDGRMAFGLRKYGKIKQIRDWKCRIFTNPRTLKQQGNFRVVLLTRVRKEIFRFRSFLPHRNPSS